MAIRIWPKSDTSSHSSDEKALRVKVNKGAQAIKIIILIENMSKAKINIKQVSMIASSKKEIFRLLQLEGDVYLPPLPQANHVYVSGIISGNVKVCIKPNDYRMWETANLK